MQVQTQGVSIPSGLAARGEIGRIELGWQAGGAEGLLGYNVYRSERSDEGYEQLASLEGASFTTGQTTYVDSNLAGGQLYFYKVSAVVEGAESESSGFVSATAEGDDVAPSTPLNVSAVPDEVEFGRVVVSWNAPTQDEGGGELTGLAGYVVYRSEGNASSFVPVDSLAADVRESADTGLGPLTTYYYTVLAYDDAGNESNRAGAVQVQTQGVSIPSGLAARGEIGRIELGWQASGAEGLLGYNVYRSERSDEGYEQLASLEDGSFTTGQTAYVDSNLAGGQLYFYKVSAVVGGVESESSGFVSATAEGDEAAPAPPGDLVAIADASSSSITLGWSAPTQDGNGGELTGLASYIISRSKDDASGFAAIDTIAVGTTQFVDPALEASTLYFYAISAVDATGNTSSRSASVSARTAGIASPAGVAATGGIERIVVSWQASDEEDLLGYNVYRSARSDEGYERFTGVEGTSYTTGQTEYTDTGLTGGAAFFYKVSVVTAAGESQLSAFDGATVTSDIRAPAAPSFIDGTPVVGEPGQLELVWNAPTTDFNGSELTGLERYTIYRADSASGRYEIIGRVENATTLIDTGLTTQTIYYYRMEAMDAAGNVSPRSSAVAINTGGVDMPKNVRLTARNPISAFDTPSVTVRWDAAAGEIFSYEVQRTTVVNSTNDADYEAILPNTLQTSRPDNSVSRGQTYYYRVRARDVDDEFSAWTVALPIEIDN